MEQLARKSTLSKLHDFCAQRGAGLVFLHGRRRVGKTWILQSLEAELGKRCFRFLCRKHRRESTFLREMVELWVRWSSRPTLGQIKTSSLSWALLFEDIASFAAEQKSSNGTTLVFIIDEIQWLSTDYGQSAGILKSAWDEWSRRDCLRVILCGSSSRFFSEQFGEGSPLRGIQTQTHIKVMPFSLATLKNSVARTWTLKEAVLAYMCLGGIPYYWQRVAIEKGFRRGMNEACCLSSTIFLNEWREIITTEFRTDAVNSLSRLFPTLMTGDEGATLSEIAEIIGVEPATAARLLEKLVNFGYVLRCTPEYVERKAGKVRSTQGARFILNDFFLHFYFSVLRPMDREISTNESGLLFPYKILHGGEKEYIPDFTGRAFERFVNYHIDIGLRHGEWGDCSPRETLLWQKLDFPDANYETEWNMLVRGSSNNKIISQIDILITHEGERCVRVIECKWKNEGSNQDLEDVRTKLLPARFKGFTRRNFLAVSYEPTPKLLENAAEAEVKIITLADFL